MSEDDSFPDHKLCGFLCAVLTFTPSPQPNPIDRCEIFGEGFRSENGVVLAPVCSPYNSEQCEESEGTRARRTRRIGSVNGSISVVHQLHALESRSLLKIDARVVFVDVREGCSEARAVVLIDVYVPIELWSGWQFPKSGAVAGALFRHLRTGGVLACFCCTSLICTILNNNGEIILVPFSLDLTVDKHYIHSYISCGFYLNESILHPTMVG